MKLLQLCKKFPCPARDGESIAVSYLSQALAGEGWEITLLCMNTSKDFIDVDACDEDLAHYTQVHSVEVNNEVNGWGAFKNLFSKKSYHVSRYEDDNFEEELIKLLRQETFDIVQMETLYLAPYVDTIKKHSDAMIVMRAHNVEHEIWQRHLPHMKFIPHRMYMRYLTRKLKRYEIDHLNTYDFLVSISDVDLDKFRALGYTNGATALPIGLDLSMYEPSPLRIEDPLSLAFIGSLDWMPNLDGIQWFVDEVWPAISEEHPEVSLHIAGRQAPENLLSSRVDGVHVLGEVKCARAFMNQHDVMIVPLRSGSGMRVKILEAMALGRVVITTSMGLEGIPAVDGLDVLVADTPEAFVSAIRRMQTAPELRQQISTRAIEFVHERFSHQALGQRLSSALLDYRSKKKTWASTEQSS